jgi:crossover junction endodeoxyribonuclease RuvC
MMVMGIDPGSRVTGYGFVAEEGGRLGCVDYGVIRPQARGPTEPIATRLKIIFDGLCLIIRRHSPDVVAVESVFHAANVKSALTLGHVRGVVLLAAVSEGLPLIEYSPLEVKKAVTGYGRADKHQIQTMVKTLLRLDRVPEPHDAADALAIALCQAFGGASRGRRNRRWSAAEVPR